MYTNVRLGGPATHRPTATGSGRPAPAAADGHGPSACSSQRCRSASVASSLSRGSACRMHNRMHDCVHNRMHNRMHRSCAQSHAQILCGTQGHTPCQQWQMLQGHIPRQIAGKLFAGPSDLQERLHQPLRLGGHATPGRRIEGRTVPARHRRRDLGLSRPGKGQGARQQQVLQTTRRTAVF